MGHGGNGRTSLVFHQGGTRPLPPLGRRSALHPGSFSLDAQRKGTKRNAPRSASAEFFAGGRTNSRPSTSYGADRTGPSPLPAKKSSHNALRGRKNQPKANKNTHGKPGSPNDSSDRARRPWPRRVERCVGHNFYFDSSNQRIDSFGIKIFRLSEYWSANHFSK